MGMSDCIKCWSTPCTCGWEYRDWTKKDRINLASTILGIRESSILVLNIPEDHPQKKQGTNNGKQTRD